MIIARTLSKRLGRVMAVDSADLEIADGEKVSVFGPNGAGKSTLLRLVAGIYRPTLGEVRIDGKDPRRMKRSIGYLGHEPLLYGYLTAKENLVFFADLYGMDRALADLWLESVGLRNKSSARVNELSQGEARRVGLARALLHDPPYLLLDEPFANLDSETAGRVQSLLDGPDRTVLLVTHDHRRGMSMSDRVIWMDAGRMQERPMGSPSPSQPAHYDELSTVGELPHPSAPC